MTWTLVRMGLPNSIVLLALAVLGPADAKQATPRERETVRRIIVYGTDPCPPSPPGEIIVCAPRPESERYRLPPRLREGP